MEGEERKGVRPCQRDAPDPQEEREGEKMDEEVGLHQRVEKFDAGEEETAAIGDWRGRREGGREGGK